MNAIGIGDFCLELHSNKASKKVVLKQMEKSLDAMVIKHPDAFQEKADAIFKLRKELNEIVFEIHKPRHFGFSLYETISRVEQHSDVSDCAFSKEWISSLTSRKYERCLSLCKELANAVKNCGSVHNHTLREYKNTNYSINEKNDIISKLGEYSSLLVDLKAAASKICAALNLGSVETYTQYKALLELSQLLADATHVPSTVLQYKDLHLYVERLLFVCTAGKRQDSIKAELCHAFSENLLDFDVIVN